MSTNGQIDQLLEGLDEADFDDFNELNPPDGHDFEGDAGASRTSGMLLSRDERPHGSFFPATASSEAMPALGFMTARARPLNPPSAAALARARQLFLDDDDDSLDAPQEAACTTAARESSSQIFHTPVAKRPRLENNAHVPGYTRSAGHMSSKPMSETAVSLSQPRSRPPTSAPSARSFVTDLFAQADADCAQVEIPNPWPTGPSAEADHGIATNPLYITSETAGGDMQRPPTASWGFVTGGGKNVAPISQDARKAAMALFGESSEPRGTAAPSTPVRTPSTGNMVNDHGGLQAPAFATPRIAQLGGLAASGRTPLANKTNTFSQGTSPSATPIKLPKPIDIKTPLSAKRRIGLGGSTPGNTRRAKGFVTPFRKDGGGALESPISTRPSAVRAIGKPLGDDAAAKHFAPVFDLTIPPGRKGWRDAYLYPGFYPREYLAEMGIRDEIWQLAIGNAHRYQFVDDNSVAFGVKAAYIIMRRDGCHLTAERWVENHWSLILWKLAGMVHAKPDLFRSLWRWEQVLNQLKYRYEREFGAVQRPIIRKIQEHDASAATPMILCVSGITFPPPSKDEEGKPVQHRPYLDLTDGWYRLLAEVDDCLARAIRRGRIAVGRKLGVAAAKLESAADGAEVLDAYEKSRLVISGNSTHLARWDAKLGAQHQPFIASLASLSVDGGLISVLDVTVEKVFPLAFMNSNRGTRDPPWDEKEELERQEKWNEKHAAESARLQDTMQKRLEAIEDLAGTLWSQAEDLRGPFGEPPDTVDADFEDLLEAHDAASQIRRLPPSRLYHLAMYARIRVDKEMAEMRDEIEGDLKIVCPPRDVRDFRMVRLKDAWSGAKESSRTAMLNVWDARQLGDEIQEGKRYLISSLVPAKNGQWALPKPGSGIKPEVYLHTRRDTRWSAVEE